ncbi:oxidative stress defense protein [Shewanella avicenniae]|uniref:Oxidative stress defense protein n=1 Tax=Shewanella avicenniae TaxID=2814294 RepID=A0ABX7QQB4_9GAMM|nr:oxidative stress defense protein [Shewanella avicenniae]QSX33217.1 oxidative stress defense protein [Shewanella avicenniae]
MKFSPLTRVVLCGMPALLASYALQAADLPLLETVGVSQIEAEPDQAQVTVAVVVKADTAAAAKDQADTAVAAFIERLLKTGVAKQDISSANLALAPQYRYPKDEEPVLVGYRASRDVTLTLPLALLNPVLDKALAEGLNSVRAINLKSSKELQLKLQARDAAIADAKQKAKALAKGFDAKLDGVWSIRYFEQTPVASLRFSTAELKQASSDQSYQYGSVTFSDRVEVSYKLKQ